MYPTAVNEKWTPPPWNGTILAYITQKLSMVIKLNGTKKELLLNHWLDVYVLSTAHDALCHFINFLQTKILPLKRTCPTWPSTLGPSIRRLTVCCASFWSSAGNLSRSVTPTLDCFTVVQKNSLSTRPTCRYWKVNVSLIFFLAVSALFLAQQPWAGLNCELRVFIWRKLQHRVLKSRMENCDTVYF